MHGFTCGVDDLLILKAQDNERKKQLESCEKSGELVHRNFIGIEDENLNIGVAFALLSFLICGLHSLEKFINKFI